MQSPRREAQDHHSPAKGIEYPRLWLQERRHPPSAGLKCSSVICAHPIQNRDLAIDFTENLIIRWSKLVGDCCVGRKKLETVSTRRS